MSKLSKEKKDKLVLTCIGSVGTIAVLYFLVITDQKREIIDLDSKISATRVKRDMAQKQVKRLSDTQGNLEEAKKILAQKQAEMPKPKKTMSGSSALWRNCVQNTVWKWTTSKLPRRPRR